MGYEEYMVSTRAIRSKVPTMSLRRGAKIGLNLQVVEILKREGFERVLLLWDVEKRKVALARAPEGKGYSVTYNKYLNQASIGVKSFADHIGLKPNERVKIALSYKNELLEGVVPEEALIKRKKPEH